MNIDYNNIKKAALVLRAANHKLRQQMIAIIFESKKITVTELYVRLMLEQSVVSQHLSILRKARIVTTKRDGKFIWYSVDEVRLKMIEEISQKIIS